MSETVTIDTQPRFVTPVDTTTYPAWPVFWDDLENTESLWARKLSAGERDAFEATIESMIQACIPSAELEGVRKAWELIGFGRKDISFSEDHDLRWNIFVDTQLNTGEPSAEQFLRDLQIACEEQQERGDVGNMAAAISKFLNHVKHMACVTVVRFLELFAKYTTTLPKEAILCLSHYLYAISFCQVLCHIA